MEPPPSDSKRPLVRAFTSTAIAIVVLFMALRVYIRGYLMRAWKLDDTVFIFAALLTVVQLTVMICAATYGALGLHIWMVTPSDIRIDSNFLAASSMLYPVSISVLQATYLTQYRRAFGLPNIKLFCDVFLGIVFVILVATLIFGGIVMKGFMDPHTLPNIKATGFSTFTYFTGASTLVTGIVIFILPIALVGRMRLETMQKVGLIASFGVGIFTSAISVFRILSISLGLGSNDPYYATVPFTLTSAAELTSAIICACVPLMRPLLSCAGTTGYGRNSSREPLSAASEKNASRGHRGHGLPLQSPTNSSFTATPNMARVADAGGSVNGDMEGYHASQQARKSINAMGPLPVYLPTPTKPRVVDLENV